MAALNHPNVLSIYDYGHEGDITYAVMELLEGETLQQSLEKGPLPVSKALESPSRSPRASRRPTRRASCTGTSSRPTCFSPRPTT